MDDATAGSPPANRGMGPADGDPLDPAPGQRHLRHAARCHGGRTGEAGHPRTRPEPGLAQGLVAADGRELRRADRGRNNPFKRTGAAGEPPSARRRQERWSPRRTGWTRRSGHRPAQGAAVPLPAALRLHRRLPVLPRLFRQAEHDQDLLFQDLLATAMLRYLPIDSVPGAFEDVDSGVIRKFRNWLMTGHQALYRDIGIVLGRFLVASGQAGPRSTYSWCCRRRGGRAEPPDPARQRLPAGPRRGHKGEYYLTRRCRSRRTPP